MIEERIALIQNKIASHPDFPKSGVVFRDLFPVLRCPRLFEDVISLFAEHLNNKSIPVDAILGLESRGFLFAPSLALRLKVPFVPIRKKGKLPGQVVSQTYTLEYGQDAIEIQTDSIDPGMSVVIVDDLVATGGSMEAAVKLVKSIGATVQQCLTVMELTDLKGSSKISAPLYSLVQY